LRTGNRSRRLTKPKGGNVKSRTWTSFPAIALLAALAIPIELVAQEQRTDQPGKVQHYKLSMLPTLGGSWSIAQGINNKGQVVGGDN